jgi:hypothetical protein
MKPNRPHDEQGVRPAHALHVAGVVRHVQTRLVSRRNISTASAVKMGTTR